MQVRPSSEAANIDATWLAALIESSHDAIVSKTLDGTVLSWNRGAERLFGYTADEMVGSPITRILPPDRLFEEAELLARLGRGERIEQYETVRLRKDSRPIHVSVTLSPIRDASGRVIGVSKIARDIIDRERGEEVSKERRRWLEGMLNSLGEGVIAVDKVGRVSFMNPVAERLTGWTQPDATGRPIDAIVWLVEENRRRRLDARISQALSHGEKTIVEHQALLISREGVEYPVVATTAPIHDESGGVFGAIVILGDATDARRASHVQGLLAAVIESSDDAIVTKTLEGVVTSWNPGAERLFGYTAAEMVGRPITVILPPERLAEETDFLGRLARGERIRHYETVRMQKNGRAVDVSVSLSPIRDGSVRVVGVSKIARDISEQKRLERERATLLDREQAALREAVTANRLKDEFLATLSHELRTPVNAVLGWATLLGSGHLKPDDTARAINVIVRNAQLQTELIEQLLDVSRIMVGKLKLEVRPVDLADVVRAAIDSIQPSATIKGLNLHPRLDDGPTTVMGDAARLQQIVWNLLTNALKFTPSGGHIDVQLQRHESSARLVVTDTGVGIASETLPTIFDRFKQADASSTRRHLGLGLGLAIVRHLVDLHGGSVWAESEGVGCGARFTVELSLLRGHRHGIPAISLDERGSIEGGELSGVRILVVDDNDDARELVGQVLTRAGATVCEVNSAAAAVKAAQARVFDVVVADIGMPEMDGYELLRELRQRGIRVATIALTAFATEQDCLRATQTGFRAHLAKPVVPDDLLRAVATAMGAENRGGPQGPRELKSSP